jgi:hypothetical protein
MVIEPACTYWLPSLNYLRRRQAMTIITQSSIFNSIITIINKINIYIQCKPTQKGNYANPYLAQFYWCINLTPISSIFNDLFSILSHQSMDIPDQTNAATDFITQDISVMQTSFTSSTKRKKTNATEPPPSQYVPSPLSHDLSHILGLQHKAFELAIFTNDLQLLCDQLDEPITTYVIDDDP